MVSLGEFYKQYVNERLTAEVIESDQGFAVIKAIGKECLVVEIFVAPRSRRTGEGRKLMDRVSARARELGCSHLSGNFKAQKSSISLAKDLGGINVWI
ncbi:MAG: GNAT family N-acetyltransferase [Hyphomicrobiaceae bacterium]|nr:MAG: GNAT family N-acetyltransferase [Hyphomicrobiaceae bacterium]